MHFIKIGKRAINFDTITYCEVQMWQDTTNVKIFFVGVTNPPLVLTEDEGKEFCKYIDYVAEKPVV